MECGRIVFSRHAVTRMFERSIARTEVRKVLRTGESIEAYPDDDPFPSALMLGFVENRPLHVVVAVEDSTETCYVITAYDPDPLLWESNFRTRRTS
ncbi:MAG: DUF4258 domain-containing protein [Thermodesulfobacteriota bacterium]